MVVSETNIHSIPFIM